MVISDTSNYSSYGIGFNKKETEVILDMVSEFIGNNVRIMEDVIGQSRFRNVKGIN